MIRNFPVIIALAASALSTVAFAAQERWSVSEGLAGEPHGVWTVETTGDELTAFGEMFDANGEKTTYFLTGKREKGELVFDRKSIGSMPKCTYKITGSPQENGEPLPGVIDCNGTNESWRAKKIPEPLEDQIAEETLPKLPFPIQR